jgi:hypothetical protein
VLSLYEHFAQLCLDDDWCNFKTLPPSTSLVFHYKPNEVSNATMTDTTIFKYKDELVKVVNQTLADAKFTP